VKDENNPTDRKLCSETSGAASIRLSQQDPKQSTRGKKKPEEFEDAPSRCIKRHCHCRRLKERTAGHCHSSLFHSISTFFFFARPKDACCLPTLRTVGGAMGGLRCRLGWCLGPGAVFKTAAPYSVVFCGVSVSVRAPAFLVLLASWSPGLLASSFWFRHGVCRGLLAARVWLCVATGVAGDAHFVGSCRICRPLLGLSRWRRELLVAPGFDRSAFARFVDAASMWRNIC
jgi:hypothetical protein